MKILFIDYNTDVNNIFFKMKCKQIIPSQLIQIILTNHIFHWWLSWLNSQVDQVEDHRYEQHFQSFQLLGKSRLSDLETKLSWC